MKKLKKILNFFAKPRGPLAEKPWPTGGPWPTVWEPLV